ncbi:MAG: Hsp20 family protein [Leptospirillia bacterium]
MPTLDFTPLFRSTIGFDRLAGLMDSAMADAGQSPGYPPYDVEVIGDDHYQITMAVAGFTREELSIDVHDRSLTVTGKKPEEKGEHKYLHRGIARRGFVQKFQLADYVKVTGAGLADGLLTVTLERELPETMKPRTIEIGAGPPEIEDQDKKTKVLTSREAAA